MRLISATYSAPSRNATPFGMFSLSASVRTFGFSPEPGVPLIAYTFPPRVPTNRVPRWPRAMERAAGTSSAYTSILNPTGTRTFSSTLSVAGLARAVPARVQTREPNRANDARPDRATAVFVNMQLLGQDRHGA